MRTTEDINNLLLAGADKVSINTAAIMDTNIVKKSAEQFGSQCIVVAVDAKKTNTDKWEVFTHGGRNRTGKDVLNFVKKDNKQLLNFKITKTMKPEVYDLYLNDADTIKKICYAYIPNIKNSKYF